ncbi:hypothetical protein CISG_00605 [Coccidioides immitis RMSCC 3703]|uniref:Uncharacterized protein n=1 Tax=Coccidioides immitis RMSCC 3703 TaxID=454286 RepID=A0A0J8QRF6_COCIT|nr:hypothetical protein CISG_00605 [Coccidioides immitis RMSCC 3703]
METNQPPSAGLPLPKTAIEKCLQEDFPPSSSQLTNGISEIYYILLVLEKDWIRILSLKAFFAQLPQHKGMVTVFAKAHEALCTNLPSLTFSEAEDTFTSQLDALIREPTLKEHLVYIALTNFAAIMGYGRQNRLFLEVLTRVQGLMECVQSKIPWDLLLRFLNKLYQRLVPRSFNAEWLKSDSFPHSKADCCLPEDFALRGLIWTRSYYPEQFVRDVLVNEKRSSYSQELPLREERCYWLGRQIASENKWIQYDNRTPDIDT